MPKTKDIISQAMSALGRRPRTITPALRKANAERSRAYWKTHKGAKAKNQEAA